MAFTTGDNNFGTAKWIVDPTAGQGTHTTIAAALTAASSGQTIFVRPGTYTENLTLKAGVNLSAYEADGFTPNVTIIGKASFSSAGTVGISGIRLQTNSDFVLAVTGSAASIVNLLGCWLNLTNTTGISFTTSNTSAAVVLINCQGNLGTTGIAIYSMSSTGTLGLESCYFTNTGASTTASANSAGIVDVLYCTISAPFSCSSTGGIFFEGSIVDSSATNTTAITTAGNQVTSIGTCQVSSGSASTVSIGTGTQVNIVSSSVNSSNTNAITGAGTLVSGLVTFIQSSTTNVTVQTPYNTGVGVKFFGYLGTAVSNVTGDGTLYAVVFDSESFDVSNSFNSSTGVFTAPVAGKYRFNAQLLITGIGVQTSAQIQIVASGISFVGNVISAVAVKDVNSQLGLAIETSVNMAAGDTAVVKVVLSGSTKTTGVYGEATVRYSYFCGELIE